MVAGVLASCGGGGGNFAENPIQGPSPGGSSDPPQSPAGVWGFGSNDPSIPVAIINSAREAIIYTPSDGEIFTGTAEVSGSDLTIAVEGYADWGSTFSDGSRHGMGQLVGTVTTGGTLSASLTFTTNGGTTIAANWTLPYYSFYEISSLSDISVAAGFTGGAPGTTIFIDPSGVMTSQTASGGCVLNGSVSTADTTHNVYEVSYTYTDCSGAWQGLNGVPLTGLAFNSTNDVPGKVAPKQFTFVVTGASATAKYGILSTLIVAGF
jgi:hypothetical protein